MHDFKRLSRYAGVLTGVAALLLGSSALAKGGIGVASDQVKVINFPQAVATVYIGNPSIADVTMIDPNHAFLIGKNYGTTNVLALDSKGNQIFNKPVTVTAGTSLVTLHEGAAHRTFSCTTSRCEATPMPGDQRGPFDDATGEMDRRVAQAKGSTTPEVPQAQ